MDLLIANDFVENYQAGKLGKLKKIIKELLDFINKEVIFDVR